MEMQRSSLLTFYAWSSWGVRFLLICSCWEETIFFRYHLKWECMTHAQQASVWIVVWWCSSVFKRRHTVLPFTQITHRTDWIARNRKIGFIHLPQKTRTYRKPFKLHEGPAGRCETQLGRINVFVLIVRIPPPPQFWPVWYVKRELYILSPEQCCFQQVL
jgi:hypothetical protein